MAGNSCRPQWWPLGVIGVLEVGTVLLYYLKGDWSVGPSVCLGGHLVSRSIG